MNNQVKIMMIDPIDKSTSRLRTKLLSEFPDGTVDICTSHLTGFNKIQNVRYDVIILNMDFMEVDPIEFVKILKHYNPAIKIIATTSDYSLEKVFGVVREGVDDFIKQPFNDNRLLKAVKTALNTRVYQQFVSQAA